MGHFASSALKSRNLHRFSAEYRKCIFFSKSTGYGEVKDDHSVTRRMISQPQSYEYDLQNVPLPKHGFHQTPRMTSLFFSLCPIEFSSYKLHSIAVSFSKKFYQNFIHLIGVCVMSHISAELELGQY